MIVDQLLRLYPRAWRERYGEEFAEVVGDRDLSMQQTIDILAGAVDAWISPSVRARVRGLAGGTKPGGDRMIEQLKMRCVTSTPRYTKKDALISAGVLIATSALLTTAGIMLDRQNYPVPADVLKSLAFPVALTVSMPFAILKGQSRRVILFSLIVPNAILFFASWLATKI